MPFMKPIHIAIASTTSKPGQVVQNLQQIREFAERAGRDGAHLLLTPELSASGYGPYPEVLATAEIAGEGPIFIELSSIARDNQVAIAAGFVEACNGKRYLSHYVVFPDGRHVVQRKNRVMLTERPLDPSGQLHPPDTSQPNYDPADPGQPCQPQFSTFELAGVRCAVVICADAGITRLNEILAEQRVQLLLLPTGAGGDRKDRVTTEDLRAEAGRQKYLFWLEKVFFPGPTVIDCIQYRRALAAVNLCGHDGLNHYHIGHGSIITPRGEVAALLPGLPNLDRQRPTYAHSVVDVDDCVPATVSES